MFTAVTGGNIYTQAQKFTISLRRNPVVKPNFTRDKCKKFHGTFKQKRHRR